MKKSILAAILSLFAIISLGSEKLTLKIVPGGPEHGSLREYFLIGAEERYQYSKISNLIIGDTISSQETTITKNHYLDRISVIGEGFDYDLIIEAYHNPGKKISWKSSPVEKETGFSNWGFRKKYDLITKITSYTRLANSRSPIISVGDEYAYRPISYFHFGSIAALLMMALLGVVIAPIIFDIKALVKRTKEIDNQSWKGDLFFFLAFLIAEIYSVIWSYRVGGPFLYLAAATFTISILFFLWAKARHKRIKSKEISEAKEILET